MSFIISASSILLFVLTALWVRSHAHPENVSFPILLVSVISFGLGFAGVLLLPLDLSLGGRNNNEIELIWSIAYWGTFFLAYICLPFIRDFVSSGHFTFMKRWKDAWRESMRYMVFMFIATAVFVLLLAIHLKTLHLFPILMALGNTYGLLLVVVLLGYGLVDIPRMLLRWAKPKDELNRIYLLAAKADEILYDSVWELQDIEEEIEIALTNPKNVEAARTNAEVRYCTECLAKQLKEISQLPPMLQGRRTKNIRTRSITPKPIDTKTTLLKQQFTKVRSNSSSSFDKMDENVSCDDDVVNDLATLHMRLKSSQVNIDNAMANFMDLVELYKTFNHIIELNNLPETGISSKFAKHGRLLLRSFMYRSLSLVCVGLSIVVLWSECTLVMPYNLSPFGIFLNTAQNCEESFDDKSNSIIFLESVSLLLPLLYISVCVFWSLKKAMMFTSFKLNPNKMTSSVGLIFNAQNFIRIEFPLCYNFLLMMKYSDDCNFTAFSMLMSDMETVPFFGTDFSFYAPLLVMFFSISTYFNFYPRILNWIGFEHEDMVVFALNQGHGTEDEVVEKLKSGENLLRIQAQNHINKSCGSEGFELSSNSLV